MRQREREGRGNPTEKRRAEEPNGEWAGGKPIGSRRRMGDGSERTAKARVCTGRRERHCTEETYTRS